MFNFTDFKWPRWTGSWLDLRTVNSHWIRHLHKMLPVLTSHIPPLTDIVSLFIPVYTVQHNWRWVHIGVTATVSSETDSQLITEEAVDEVDMEETRCRTAPAARSRCAACTTGLDVYTAGQRGGNVFITSFKGQWSALTASAGGHWLSQHHSSPGLRFQWRRQKVYKIITKSFTNKY